MIHRGPLVSCRSAGTVRSTEPTKNNKGTVPPGQWGTRPSDDGWEKLERYGVSQSEDAYGTPFWGECAWGSVTSPYCASLHSGR